MIPAPTVQSGWEKIYRFSYLSLSSPPNFERGFFMSNLTLKTSYSIKKLVVAAMFCALALTSMFVMRINVSFLTFDAKDAVVTIAGLLLGPIYSLGLSLAVPIIESIAVGDTGFWGFLMDVLSTASFSCICALNYKYMKNIRGAMIGLGASVLSMTAVMLIFNLFIVPLYTPTVNTAAVMTMIPTLFLPFNLTKGLLNSAIVLILYKPISKALKAAKVLPKTNSETTSNANNKKKLIFSIIVTAIGILLAVVCIIIFFTVLDADFSLVKT